MMDALLLEAIAQLQASDLARPWEFQGESGHKLTPQSAPQVAHVLRWAQSNHSHVAVDYLDACRMPHPLWLDLSALRQIRQYPTEDFIIEVETGMTFGELEKVLAQHWQTFPLSYPAETTIAEVLSEDRPALETGLRGAFRDYVLKTELATPDGNLTISGADVVKNVTGYDLAKLYVGGRHAFGVVTSVTLKLMALPHARRHWVFTVNSLQAGCALSEKLLASQVPLSVCEIYQSDTGWRVLIELCGEAWLMADIQALLTGTAGSSGIQPGQHWGNSQTGEPPQRLKEDLGLALKAQLQAWSSEATRLEIALPLSQWTALAVLVSKQSILSQMRLQIRPAAGLVYISAPMFPSAALRYLQTEAQALGGFAQILQISSTDAATLSEAEAILAAFNLPEEPMVRRLLKDLKKGYDPQGVLHTPRLPL
jgi:FAD/FMN-containing dehydrogenase